MDIKEAFKHCPRCGSQFSFEDGRLQCASCRLSFYINPKPCTCVVFINSKGERLLVKRAVDPGKGLWDLPGGFVEENETFEENAVREVKEELGMNINSVDLHYLISHTEPYPFQEVVYPTLAVCFITKFPEGARPKPADDVASYRFFSLDNLPTDKFAFKAMHADLEAVAKFLSLNKL